MGAFSGSGVAGAIDANVQRAKQRKQNLSDAELNTETQSVLNDITGLQKRRAALDPNSPSYQTDVAGIDQSLKDARQALQDLYHPKNNPGALGKLVGKLKQKISGQPAPASTLQRPWSERIAGLDAAAAGGGSQAPNPILVKRKQMQEAGFTPEQIQKVEQIDAGLAPKQSQEKWSPRGQPYKGEDGNWYQTYSDPQGNVKAIAMPEGYAGPDKPLTSTQLNEQAYESAFEPRVAWADMTDEQRAYYPTWKAQQSQAITTGQHIMMVEQPDHTIKPVLVQSTTERTHPGGPTPPGMRKPGAKPEGTKPEVPKTAGAAKEAAAKTAPKATANAKPKGAGVISVGDTVGGKASPAQNKADTDVVEATKLASIAHQVAETHDALNQKRLLVSLERASAGRFTTQALDYIKQAGWGNTIEEWANKPKTGEIPADILRQAVAGADENLKAAKDAQKAAYATTTPSNPSQGKRVVSLAKAKLLPQNKGKSDAEITADIQSKGYTVKP